ncbi:cell division protein FtsH, partial [Candidatus Sumerlaeota bacterium]|nr:cell division protein FtsH [Candidatus Sumerlaeota bacterium]
GASNDIERATNLAHRMVCVFGMSERLGPRSFGEPSGHVFLGKEMTRERNFSEETATVIDEEIKRLIDEAHAKTLQILRDHRDALDRVAEALVERETIDGDEFDMLVEGKPLPPPKQAANPIESKAPDAESSSRPAPKPKVDPLGTPHIQPSA